MATAPVVVETEAGTAVVIPAAESAAPNMEEQWQRFWATVDELRNLMAQTGERQASQTAMLERLVESQQQTITSLSGQVSEGTAQVVAAIATLMPAPAIPIIVESQPLLEDSPTASLENAEPKEPEKLVPETAKETPRRRRYL